MKIDLIGDEQNSDVQWLKTELAKRGFELRIWDGQGEVPKIAVACLTEHCTSIQKDQEGYSPALSAIISANVNTGVNRVLMSIFQGGNKPVIMADVKAADFTKGREKALSDLSRALDNFTKKI